MHFLVLALLAAVASGAAPVVLLDDMDAVITCGAALDGEPLPGNGTQIVLDVCLDSALCRHQHGQEFAVDVDLFATVWGAATRLPQPWTSTSALRDALCGRSVREAAAILSLWRSETDVVANNVYRLGQTPRLRESDQTIRFVPIATLSEPTSSNTNLLVAAGFVIALEFIIIVALLASRVEAAELSRYRAMHSTELPTSQRRRRK